MQSKIGSTCGVGLQLKPNQSRRRIGFVSVELLTQGGPAEKCGVICKGDQLQKVNGRDVQSDMTLETVASLVRGPAGSTVELQFLEQPKRSKSGKYRVRLVREAVDGREREQLMERIQGIKVMVKEVQNLRTPVHAPELYAFVHIDKLEARTRSAKNDAAAANNVVWNQKMAFPSCSARSLINVKVFSESTPPGLVASKEIPVDALPWDSEGHVPSLWVDLEICTSKFANNGDGVAPQLEAPRMHLQAWILLKPNAELTHQPPSTPSPNALPKGILKDASPKAPHAREMPANPISAAGSNPVPAAGTCNVVGCSRMTWNGKINEQCCRTCKSSNGSCHGPECEKRGAACHQHSDQTVSELYQSLLPNGKLAHDVLAAPRCWAPMPDPMQVLTVEVPDGPGRAEAMRLFRLTAPASVHVESVCYVQNLALWYSFAVKRQTMLMREKGVPDAAARYERRLFHGCPADMVSKIVQQGFNRSFTGATSGRASFGKGVYFARDARTSMWPEYSPPDANGVQHVFLVRVVVGEFCKGKKDALTPAVRRGNQLYDSTVDDVDNPSIFVTYNDSQAYPDILIKFTL